MEQGKWKKKNDNWKGKDNSRIRKRCSADSSSRLTRHRARVFSAFALWASYISLKIESAEGTAAGLIYTVSFSFNPTWEPGRGFSTPCRVYLLSVLKETFKISNNLLSFPSLAVTRSYSSEAIKNISILPNTKDVFFLTSRLVLLLLLLLIKVTALMVLFFL